jgi:hypothetical protein
MRNKIVIYNYSNLTDKDVFNYVKIALEERRLNYEATRFGNGIDVIKEIKKTGWHITVQGTVEEG